MLTNHLALVHYLVLQVSPCLCTCAEGKKPVSTSPCLLVGVWYCKARLVINSSFSKHSHNLDSLGITRQIGEVWQVSNSTIGSFTWESFIAGLHSILIMAKDIAALLVQAASQENINHVFLKQLNWFLGRKISLSTSWLFLLLSPIYGDLSS